MRKPERGVICAGCPHRAAYVVVKEAIGRGRGRVYCGDAGCVAVGPVHPAAATVDGGEGALLPRYRQAVPQAGDAVRTCAHFIRDTALMADEASSLALAAEGDAVILCVLASSKAFLSREAVEGLAGCALELGAADAHIVDPFDTLGCQELVRDLVDAGGVHAIIFSSPCAQLGHGEVEPVEVDRYTCVGCQRCKQITGCPALEFTPPAFTVMPDVCAGCDLCCDFCRTHVIYSPRQRMTLDERRRARFDRIS